MKLDLADVESRYRKMSEEEFSLLKRADLTSEVHAIYDRELASRSTPEWIANHPKPIIAPPKPPLSKEIRKQIKQEAAIAWKQKKRSQFWLSWREFVSVTAVILLLCFVPAILLMSPGQAVTTGTGAAGTCLAVYLFIFDRRRTEEKAFLQKTIEQKYQRSIDEKLPLAVNHEFFEARCPRCMLVHAIFRDDHDIVSCTCGARLMIERNGHAGILKDA